MRWFRWLDRRSSRRRTERAAAEQARIDAERKLLAARRDWPAVQGARDQLAEWIDAALRGGRAR